MGPSPNFFARFARFVPTLVVVGLAICFQVSGFGLSLDRRVQDAFTRVVPSHVPSPTRGLPDTAVVAIDPRSLRAIEGWPWPRDLYADAIENLAAAGARAIVFDIDFSSPSTPERDARLAESLRANGHVVLATFSQFQTLSGGAEMEIINRPIPILEEAAAALGSVLVPVDPDGVVRETPRTSSIGGEAIPSLARAALRIAAPRELRDRIVATDLMGTSNPADFRRIHPSIPVVPFIDVLEGRFDPDAMRDRTVFIGATAAEFQDLWATPAEPVLPGVLIQAIAYRTAAAEVMGEDVAAAAPLSWVAAGLLLLGLATMPRRGQGGAGRALVFVVALGGLFLVAWFSFWEWGVQVPVTVGLGLLAAQYMLGIEGLQRRIRAQADAQEFSLSALARIGDVTVDSARDSTRDIDGKSSLVLALELLGDVVGARGVVLLRAKADQTFREDRLEWRPDSNAKESLEIDLERAAESIEKGSSLEVQVREGRDTPATVVYSPLIAGSERIGVLIVFARRGQDLDPLHRRTIATVGAQLALTAQNLQLVERLRETFESSIAAVASAVEARDGYTDQHCRRLAAFSSLVGRRLGMPEAEIRAMELGALLHDVGKIGIPDAILNKPGGFSEEERSVMQRHPEIGARIVGPVVGLDETTLHCVIHHHERWDGAGYPAALRGEGIPLAARIVTIVDVWDALSSSRPYKPAFPQSKVRSLLLKGRGSQFDPDLVDLFLEILDEQGEEMLELIAGSSGQGVAV